MTALVSYLRGLPRTLWLYWAFLLALLYGFALLAEEVLEHERIRFDRAVLALLEARQSSGLDALAGALDLVGGAYVLLPLALVATAVLWRRHRRSGVFFALAVLGAMALNGVAKAVFERSRPDRFEALVAAVGYAFPSGHTMGSTALALALFCLVRFHARRWQGPALALGVLFAVAVGVSRSYLQVHYPSDVIAAWLLSTAWVLGVNAWYSRTHD